MKIGIDARMYGLEHAGIGRYAENLITNLLRIDKSNEYTLLARRKDLKKFKVQSSKFKVVAAEARHYSVKEQLLLPWLLQKERLDLVHFPHFNVPVLFGGRYVVTIHDMLWHEMKGGEVTTLSGPHYFFKYYGYRFVFANAVKRAKKILVPSKWVKNKIISRYKLSDNKVIVTYEGVDKKYSKGGRWKIEDRISQKLLVGYGLTRPFFIYTGSAYPHKNLERLIRVIGEIRGKEDVMLAIASARDVFWERLEKMIREKNLKDRIKLLGFVPDDDLVKLYQNATGFVFPSLSEGFGLPGLEAMASGCPVIASNAGSLPEIYGDAALYFDPLNSNDMAKRLKLIMDNGKLRKELISKGIKQAKKYSWEKTAKETLKAYEL